VYDEWFADTTDWSPNGSYFITGDAFGFLSVFDSATGDIISSLEFDGVIYWVEWSPDGLTIAVASGAGLSLVDPFSEQVTSIFPGPTTAVSWNNSGDILVLGGEDGNVTFITSDGTIVTPSTCNPSFTIADGDTTALISAITTANGTPEPDTICLAEGGTYTFTAAYGSSNALPKITSVFKYQSRAHSTVLSSRCFLGRVGLQSMSGSSSVYRIELKCPLMP
jgi:WD40 repeat protein